MTARILEKTEQQSPTKKTFKVIIAYQTLDDGIRAVSMANRLGAQCEMTMDVWKWSILQHKDASAVASQTARDADMIIIASQSNGNVPTHLMTWIESWMESQSGKGSALVALLGPKSEFPGEPCPLRIYLRDVAEKAGMDFICNSNPRSGQKVHTIPFSTMRTRKRPVSTTGCA
jgi:hypothetical protein